MKVKPVLGRGLGSLIPRPEAVIPPPVARRDDGTSTETIVNIDIDKIKTNPYQPRADFDPVALDELKRSIQEKGIIQPITVCRSDEGYQLISGERRVRAAREAGMRQLPAYVIRIRSSEELLELALIENLQREHLNPIEIAISYRRLIVDCNLTHEQVSDRLGKDRATVTNALRLLKLPEVIQTAVRKEEVSAGHARALVAIEDAAVQMAVFQKTVEKGLSVRELERLVQRLSRKKSSRARPFRKGANGSLATVEEQIRQTLGTKVEVTPVRDGRGHIIIDYYSSEDLDRLLELFGSIHENHV